VKGKQMEIGETYTTKVILQRKGAEWLSYDPNSFLSADFVQTLSRKAEVSTASFFVEVNARNKDLMAAIPSYETEYKDTSGFYESDFERNAGSFTLAGIENIEDHINFRNGDEIVSGRGFDKDDGDKPYAVVSEEFVHNNNLDIGDTFQLECGFNSDQSVDLEIIGVHSGNYTVFKAYSTEANYIYTPVNNAVILGDGVYRATYEIASAAMQSSFVEQLLAMDLEDGVELDVYEDTLVYLMAVTPFKGIENVCLSILIAVSIILTLLIGILTIYVTVEREREIGILISLGETRQQVIIQTWLETLLPLLISMTSGFIVWLLFENGLEQFLHSILPYFQKITKSMTIQGAVLILMVGVGVSILSMILPAISIMTKMPKVLLAHEE